MIHSTVNLPYVGGVATSRTTSSPSLNFWLCDSNILFTIPGYLDIPMKILIEVETGKDVSENKFQKSILWQEGQEEGAMTWNGLSIRGFKTSQLPPQLNWLLDCMSPATLVITISSWQTISIVTAAYFSRVRHLLQNMLKPLVVN